MGIWSSLDGTVSAKITTAYPAGILQKIAQENITVFDISKADDFTVTFTTGRRDISHIRTLCDKRGERLDIQGWTGILYYFLGILRRPVFLATLCLWLLLVLWLPTRILFVKVSGAVDLPESYILHAAGECGISFGAKGVKVRSEAVKNALLSKMPELQWAGVNTNGCVATICVREKTQTDRPELPPLKTDILAKEDAIIQKITVHSGTAACAIGQAVKKGDTLISRYRDSVQGLEFVGAQGEIFGTTKHQIQAQSLLSCYKRGDVVGVDKNFYLIIGKKQINFAKDSGILDTSCVKMYEQKDLTLPGGFILPVKLVIEYVTHYEMEEVTLKSDQCTWLYQYAQNYLKTQMVAGQIQNSAVTAFETEDLYSVYGVYECQEMIAQYSSEGI